MDVDGLKLSSHWAKSPSSGTRPALVLCHGFPAQRSLSLAFGETFPELADRLATDTGWDVLTFDFRGTGHSEGDFSLAGWLRDLQQAIVTARSEPNTSSVWLCGFGTGGSLALVATSFDAEVSGVATFGSPAHFDDWAQDPQRCLDRARESGAIKSKDFPADFSAWSHEFTELRPENVIAKIPPRPLMLVHGDSDEVVGVDEVRLLAENVGPSAEIRILNGAGHNLRHDPRAIAVLAGWMDRHKG